MYMNSGSRRRKPRPRGRRGGRGGPSGSRPRPPPRRSPVPPRRRRSPARGRGRRRPAHGRVALGQRLRPGGVDLDQQRPADVGLGFEEVQHRPQPGPQLVSPRLAAARRRPAPRVSTARRLVVGLQVAVLLVGEMVVEGLPVEAGAVQHRAHRGAVVAFRPDRLEHSCQDPLRFDEITGAERAAPACETPSSIRRTVCLTQGTLGVSALTL